MSDSVFEAEALAGTEELYICFGQIKRDVLTMTLAFSALDERLGAAVIVGDDALHAVLEQMPVMLSKERETGLCGPVFWAFKGAMKRVIQQVH